MNYPTAILISAALVAGALFGGNWASASSGTVGVYAITMDGFIAWRINTATGAMDSYTCKDGKCERRGSVSADGQIK